MSTLKLSSQPLEDWSCLYQQHGLHVGIQVQEEAGTQARGCVGKGFWSPGYRDCAVEDGDWGQEKPEENQNRAQSRV